MASVLELNVSALSPFQLRVAIVAAELAGEVEKQNDTLTPNGTLEIRISRHGRSFEKAFKRAYGCILFGDEPSFE